MKCTLATTLGSALAAIAGAAAFMTVSAVAASATHWRGGNISWTPGTATNEIDFAITSYWRRSFSASFSSGVGSTVSAYFFDFGDASGTTTANQVITGESLAGDWIQVTQTVSHTYASATSFTASLQSCCRLSSLQNNGDGNFRIQSLVNIDGTSSADENSASPIFEVADGGVRMFNPFMTTDPDGGAFTYALATSAEAAGGGTFTQPTALSINSATGEVTWDTDAAGTAVGQLWSISFVVTDSTGNTTPLDILLSICDENTQGCGGFVPPDPTPEAGTLALFGLGLIGLGLPALRRRRG
jgi:hypothetical protein